MPAAHLETPPGLILHTDERETFNRKTARAKNSAAEFCPNYYDELKFETLVFLKSPAIDTSHASLIIKQTKCIMYLGKVFFHLHTLI